MSRTFDFPNIDAPGDNEYMNKCLNSTSFMLLPSPHFPRSNRGQFPCQGSAPLIQSQGSYHVVESRSPFSVSLLNSGTSHKHLGALVLQQGHQSHATPHSLHQPLGLALPNLTLSQHSPQFPVGFMEVNSI
ncbi:hypothetical protein ACJIZ3_007300 [Penstemon smallii]|uniref:Uncharacterized protein n=1 Tax=Penstemon smallii TaxID=265156 RepID=A0ABD3SAH9_9LAMI